MTDKTKSDGGPAFPIHPDTMAYDEVLPYEHQRGMTLRQWYAGMAMQGILAEGTAVSVSGTAKDSWIMADAMLEAEGEE